MSAPFHTQRNSTRTLQSWTAGFRGGAQFPAMREENRLGGFLGGGFGNRLGAFRGFFDHFRGRRDHGVHQLGLGFFRDFGVGEEAGRKVLEGGRGDFTGFFGVGFGSFDERGSWRLSRRLSSMRWSARRDLLRASVVTSRYFVAKSVTALSGVCRREIGRAEFRNWFHVFAEVEHVGHRVHIGIERNSCRSGNPLNAAPRQRQGKFLPQVRNNFALANIPVSAVLGIYHEREGKSGGKPGIHGALTDHLRTDFAPISRRLLPHVAAGRGLQFREFEREGSQPRRSSCRSGGQPGRPSPATMSLHALRAGPPGFEIGRRVSLNPIAVLLLVGMVDDAGDVAGLRQHEPSAAAKPRQALERGASTARCGPSRRRRRSAGS